jgi:hypothetical protein
LDQGDVKKRLAQKALSPAAAKLPDVYYIILDAYGRDDRLKMFYGYDNAPFLAQLEQRGFYIARHSGANYDQTPLALASALSMDYLDTTGKKLDQEILRQKVDENAVIGYLRKQGYAYVNIWSGLEVSRVTTADLVLYDEPDLSTIEGEALGLTALGVNHRTQAIRYENHRKRLRGVFTNLETVAQQSSPKFVFAHLVAPHPPFVFDENGNAVNPSGSLTFADASWLLQDITRDEYKSHYIAQLQYVNKCVLQTVDAILKQSARPPIIVIQGDHGSRMNLDWESLEHTDLREPFSILNAYYVPEQTRKQLYDTITPVNSFRVILNSVYGAKFAHLPDRSYYSTASHPYDFTDVTNMLRGPQNIAKTRTHVHGTEKDSAEEFGEGGE